MGNTVSRDLSDISAQLKELSTNISAADREAKKLQKDIKLSPGNVDLVRQKYALLSKELSANAEKIRLLKSEQSRLDSEMSGKTGNELLQYQKKLQKITKQLDEATKKEAELTSELKRQNAEIAAARFDKITNGLQKVEKYAKTARNWTLALTAALVACVKASVDTGDELSDTSAKLNTSVEELQRGRYVYEMLSDGSDAYDSSLSALGSTMTSIAKGRGKAYLSTLTALGLSTKELNKMTTGEQLNAVTQALAKVTDETQRTQYAMILMGDAGRSVAAVAGAGADEIERYTQKLNESGIISTEQANVADTLANEFATAKNSVSVAMMEITVALVPAVLMIVDFVKNTVVPLIEKVAGFLDGLGESGQRVLLVVAVSLIILPKAIALIVGIVKVVKLLTVATAAQGAALGVLSTVGAPVILILAAIAAVVLLLVKLFSALTKETDKSGDALTAYTDKYSALLGKKSATVGSLTGQYDKYVAGAGDTAAALAVTEKTITGTENTLNINTNVRVTAEGDTQLSRETAQNIADLVADQVNERLGELTYGNP